jgi:DNA-binding response OmpR family regulator
MSNILVVDDEKSIQAALALALSDDGHNVFTAQNGEEALSLLANTRYDLVLTDLRMPKMDGLQLIQTIRKNWGENIPVLVITAYANTETAAKAIHEGAKDLIIKPFELPIVRAAVKGILRAKNKPEARESSGPEDLAAAGVSELSSPSLPVLSWINQTVFAGFDILKQLYRADHLSLVIFQNEPRKILFKRGYSHRRGYSAELEFDAARILPLLAQRGQSFLIETIADDIQFQEDFGIESGSVAVNCFKYRTTLTGVILCYAKKESRENFKPVMLQFLSLLADQIILKIENAVLSKKLGTGD